MRIPGAAIEERDIEHRKEIGGRDACDDRQRLALSGPAGEHRLGRVHHHFALRDLRGEQVRRVLVGELGGRQLRMAAIGGLVRIPVVHGHRVQSIVLPPDRVARHGVIDRQRHHAHTDSQRDRANHERREARAATEAFERHPRVIAEHGRTPQERTAPAAGRFGSGVGPSGDRRGS